MIWLATAEPPRRPPTLDELSRVVGEERRNRVGRTQDVIQQWHRILADRLITELLTEHGLPLGHWYARSGKPMTHAAHLSVSHDTTRVVAALSDQHVGIDVVDVRRLCQTPSSHVCSAADLRRMRRPPEAEVLARLWAGKEAATKLWGIGLMVDPRSLESVPVGPGKWTIAAPDHPKAFVRLETLGPHHLLAAAQQKEFPHPIYPPQERTSRERSLPRDLSTRVSL